MATRTTIGAHQYGGTPDYRVIGGDAAGMDYYTKTYGMSAEEAYAKLMEQAMPADMNLGGSYGGLDMNQVESDLGAFNTFIEGHNASQEALISGSDFFKSSMATAERMGATRRNPAAAALGGGTMSVAPLDQAKAGLDTPKAITEGSKYKSPQGGK